MNNIFETNDLKNIEVETFLHGMDISTDDFFKIHRINQALFFR